METIHPKLTVRDLLGYVLAYAGWIVTMSASMLALLWLRNTINVVWPALGGSRWVLRAVDRFGLLFLGLAWLVYAIFVEQHYRSSIRPDRRRQAQREARSRLAAGAMTALRRLGLDVLAQRFVRTAGIPLAVLALAYLTQQLAFLSLGG